MAFREISLENVKHMADGTIDAAFQQHVKRAVADCEDRPGDKKPRKVTLTFLMTPVMLQDGNVTDVQVEAVVKSSVPDHLSRPVECRVKAQGRAVFNDLSQDNPHQKTIDQV